MTTLAIDAPAKLNLHLDVLGKYPNDLRYHELRSLMVKISLYDRLSITIDTTHAHYQLNGFAIERNRDILFKSYELFCKLSNLVFGLSITLLKNIPQEAGLGGGSADAGALLQALNRHFNYPIDPQKLINSSKTIGADVPFFVHDTTCAIAEGIGEILTPLPARKIAFLLVKPQESMPTTYAFEELSHHTHSLPSSYSKEQIEYFWEHQAYQQFFNDFTTILPYNHPQTYHALGELQKSAGVTWANMSGSGTTLFAMAKTPHDLALLQQKYHDMGYFSQIVETI